MRDMEGSIEFYSELESFCRKKLFSEKILVVQNNHSSNQIIHSDCLQGKGFLHLTAKTLDQLAKETVQDILISNGYRMITDLEGIYIVLNALKKKYSILEYFNMVKSDIFAAGEIYRVITELAMSGSEDSIKSKVTQKTNDLKVIIEEYKNTLECNKQIDRAGLFKKAIAILESQEADGEGKQYAIYPNVQLSRLEKTFFELLTKNRYAVIDTPIIADIAVPASFHYHSLPEAIRKSLTQVDIPEVYPDILIYRTNGKNNEIKQVLRDIKRRGIRLDEVQLLYTGGEYKQRIHDLFIRYDIPATFSQGIDVSNTKACRFAYRLLDWIDNDFEVKYLLDMLRNSDISFKQAAEDSPSNLSLARYLEETNIGWSLERYRRLIDYNDTPDDNIRGKLLYEFIQDVDNGLGIKNGLVDIESFLKGLSGLVDKYVNITNELEGAGKNKVLSTLQEIACINKGTALQKEAIKHIEMALVETGILSSNPKPGGAHVSSLSEGIWLNRPYLYVVGLSLEQFKSAVYECPILGDSERCMISDRLQQSWQGFEISRYRLMETLASKRKLISLIYSDYDTENHSSMNPSGLIMEILREKARCGNIPADYQYDTGKLVEGFSERVSFLPESMDQCIDKQEAEALYMKAGAIKEIAATDTEQHNEMTGEREYLYEDIELILSSTAIERYASCPRKYFYNYVLGLHIRDGLVEKGYEWLDALNLGNLYHRILEEIFTLVKNNSYTEGELHNIIEKNVEAMLEEIPSPSISAYEHQKDRVSKDIRAFVDKELKRGVKPVALELSFRKDDESAGFDGKQIATGPVKLAFGEEAGEIFLEGAIDRVDKLSNGKYEIIDYKSGRASSVCDKNNKLKEDKLQHYLYSIAIEKLLSDAGIIADVDNAKYVFVANNQQEGILEIKQHEKYRTEYWEKVSQIIKGIKCSDFSRKIDTDTSFDGCRYCDYATICNGI